MDGPTERLAPTTRDAALFDAGAAWATAGTDRPEHDDALHHAAARATDPAAGGETDFVDGLLARLNTQLPHPDPALLVQIEVALYGRPLAPEPTITEALTRWSGPSGWTVTVNSAGDIYPSDSRVPADEVDVYLAVMLAARAASERAVNARELPEETR